MREQEDHKGYNTRKSVAFNPYQKQFHKQDWSNDIMNGIVNVAEVLFIQNNNAKDISLQNGFNSKGRVTTKFCVEFL